MKAADDPVNVRNVVPGFVVDRGPVFGTSQKQSQQRHAASFAPATRRLPG